MHVARPSAQDVLDHVQVSCCARMRFFFATLFACVPDLQLDQVLIFVIRMPPRLHWAILVFFGIRGPRSLFLWSIVVSWILVHASMSMMVLAVVMGIQSWELSMIERHLQPGEARFPSRIAM
jgi:hypothetical protein